MDGTSPARAELRLVPRAVRTRWRRTGERLNARLAGQPFHRTGARHVPDSPARSKSSGARRDAIIGGRVESAGAHSGAVTTRTRWMASAGCRLIDDAGAGSARLATERSRERAKFTRRGRSLLRLRRAAGRRPRRDGASVCVPTGRQANLRAWYARNRDTLNAKRSGGEIGRRWGRT